MESTSNDGKTITIPVNCKTVQEIYILEKEYRDAMKEYQDAMKDYRDAMKEARDKDAREKGTHIAAPKPPKDLPLVNVVGFIKDFQKPMATRKDWKCTMQIIDDSQGQGIQVSMFGLQKALPESIENNTIAVIKQIKCQYRDGYVSLLTNWSTTIYLIPLSKINHKSAISFADCKLYVASGKDLKARPTQPEIMYAKWMASRIDRLALPTAVEFEARIAQSVNVKDKFCLLQKIAPDCFYNILGEVVKIYEPGTERMSVYLSDYTANSKFHNYRWPDAPEEPDDRDGDSFGYVRSTNKFEKGWPGPYGRMTIQLTLYDEHAETIHESVKIGNWLLLSNVHVKFGKEGGCLEGVLRGDQKGYGGRMKIMMKSEDQQDPRWQEAMDRKRAYLKKFAKQKQQLLDNEARVLSKRKGDDEEPTKDNSKTRRKRHRAEIENKVAESEANTTEANTRSGLNENIKCNFGDQPVVLIKDILKYELLKKENGVEIHSPFTICQYRANVRVVNYWPHRLEDFTVGRRDNEMDILSDYSGGEDTDLEEERRNWSNGKGFSRDTWEWRFELQVEDADPKGGKERIWLTVDNHAAQGLLALAEDATSLRTNPDLLAKLREQLFKLWGDLEENKSAQLKLQKAAESDSKRATSSPTFSSVHSSPRTFKKAGAQPNVDSDIEDDETNHGSSKKTQLPLVLELTSIVPKNKAFTCCINQYGIKVDEEDPARASAGDGMRWQRKFGIFGTFIV